jgi:hypothetical protein
VDNSSLQRLGVSFRSQTPAVQEPPIAIQKRHEVSEPQAIGKLFQKVANGHLSHSEMAQHVKCAGDKRISVNTYLHGTSIQIIWVRVYTLLALILRTSPPGYDW